MALRKECQPLVVYTKSADKKHIHRWKNGWKHLFHCQGLLTVQLLWCGQKNWRTISIIIWCKFLILFIGQGPIMWPANKCLQIMVHSWAMSSYCVFAANNILLMRKWNHTFLLFAIALAWQWQIASLPKDIHQKTIKLGDQMIIEILGNHKISWYVSVSQINYLPQPSALANNWSARHWQIMIFYSTSCNNYRLLKFISPMKI